ncbi:MAG: hypothetical protein WB424_13100 [Terracidiphilus sp.]
MRNPVEDNNRNETVYKPTIVWKIILFFSSLLLFILALWMIWDLIKSQNRQPWSDLLLGTVILFFIIISAGCGFGVLRWRLILDGDRITIFDVFSTKSYEKQELAGWRILRTTPLTLVFELKKNNKRIKTGLIFKIDEQLDQWFQEIPYLDDIDQAASTQKILEDEKLGSSIAERKTAIKWGKQQEKRLNWVTTIAVIIGFIYPRPYSLLIATLIFLPWAGVALMRIKPNLFLADEYKNDKHPSVAYALMMPPLVLMLRAVLDWNIVFSFASAVLPVVLGGLLAVLILTCDPFTRKKRFSAIALIIVSLVYGYGTVIELDILLDCSKGKEISTHIIGKHVDSGKYGNSYYLELAPWGPKNADNDMEVNSESYKGFNKGDQACIILKNGALRIPWYQLWTDKQHVKSIK